MHAVLLFCVNDLQVSCMTCSPSWTLCLSQASGVRHSYVVSRVDTSLSDETFVIIISVHVICGMNWFLACMHAYSIVIIPNLIKV